MVANTAAVANNSRTARATYPKVRRIRFSFGQPAPMNRHYVEGNIVMSHLTSVLSAAFPPGEESFIRSVRRFTDRITDPELKKRVAGFIGQESVHGQEHRRLNEQLIAMGYPMVRLFTFDHDSRRQRMLVRFENRVPGYVHLAFTAAAEHYTATLAARVLGDEMQALPGDPEVWNLLNWHAVEELEHKAVAFDVYRNVGGPEWIRIAVMAAMYGLTIPVVTGEVMVSLATDRAAWLRPVTVVRQTWGVFRGPLVKGLLGELHPYMRPGFHPDDIDTRALLERWTRELFGSHGALVDHLK